ncbi:MAG: hypothetical protein KJZ65_02345 [Phycisphaerales bacterium]|nr:hypothetical protein [Phycisphaerales bacterium]
MRPATIALALFVFVGSAHAQQRCEWQAVGAGLDGTVYALASFDDGGGAMLYAGGRFIDPATSAVSFIKCWDGTSWQTVGGVSDEVYALCVYDDGGGPDLYAGGKFLTAGGLWAPGVARWDGHAWSGLGANLSGEVYALESLDDGMNRVLYVGGSFNEAITSAQNLVRWDGSTWSPAGAYGWQSPDGPVRALCAIGFGGAETLFVGGSFYYVGGGIVANNIARLDGTEWSTMGAGTNSHVYALEWFSHPAAPGLYVGGLFSNVDGLVAWHIARWNGGNWSTVGGTDDIESAVNALLVHEQDGEPCLFVGCEFVPHASHTNPAMWNGQQWADVGGGLPLSTISAMTIHDDGTGPALYVGGDFDTWGGAPSANIARWRCEDICRPDLNNDGTLNFFDVQAFLQAFSAHNPIADFTGDGQFNFFDVQSFLQAFSAGC